MSEKCRQFRSAFEEREAGHGKARRKQRPERRNLERPSQAMVASHNFMLETVIFRMAMRAPSRIAAGAELGEPMARVWTT